jgi:hypothetical protein
MEKFSGRVRERSAGDPGQNAYVAADASSDAKLGDGIALFPDAHIIFPGVDARLHGTFNMLDTHVHMTGKMAIQRGVSHTTTGIKSTLLKPLSPFFRHKAAGAVMSIAVTGTSQHPQVQQNVLHVK